MTVNQKLTLAICLGVIGLVGAAKFTAVIILGLIVG